MRRRSRGMATIAIKHDLLTYGDRHDRGGLGAHQQFIRLSNVKDGGVAVNFSGILNGVEIGDGCSIVALPGIRGYIIEQSMVLGIFVVNGVCFQLQSHFRVSTMTVKKDYEPGYTSRTE